MGNQLLEFGRENALFLGILAVLAIGLLLLRTRGTRLASMNEFDSLIAAGQPVLAEMYSNA